MLVIFSDPHLQGGGMFAKPLPNGLSTRAQIGFDCLKWIHRFSVAKRAEVILCGGDIFTQKNAIHTPLYNQAFDMFRNITKDAPMVAIPGNHDRYMRSVDERTHSLYTLGQGLDNFYVVVDPQAYLAFPSCQVMGVPAGVPLPEKLYPINRKYGLRILMLHENIIGASFPSGEIAQDGLDRHSLMQYLEDNAVDICFCGDIHRPQVMKGKRNQVITEVEGLSIKLTKTLGPIIVLTGSPYRMDFGDEGQPRGVWTVDRNVLSFVPYQAGPKFLTINDENFRKEIDQKRKGQWFFRFRISNPRHREHVEKLMEGKAFKDIMVLEFSSAVEGDAFTPTDVHNYRALVGDYVMTIADQQPDLRKQAGQITSMGLHYFDMAMEEISR